MRIIYKTSFAKAIIVVLYLITLLSSCKKLVDTNPPATNTTGASAFNTDANAIAVLNGVYSSLIRSSGIASGTKSVSLFAGLSADEFTLYRGVSSSNALSYYYKNALYANNPSTTPGTEYWGTLYNLIFICNSVIEGLGNTASSVTESTRQQLMGEAQFMRAFIYFYLTNLYGDIPLVLTSNYTISASLGRTNKADVYQQIISDLKGAENLLSSNYLDSKLNIYINNSERVRPTKWAASAFLSRIYLYVGDYLNAEIESSKVISSSLFNLLSLNSVFKKNSLEAIWQLQPVTTGWNTDDARMFVIPSNGLSINNPVYLSSSLLSSFEPGDLRRYNRNWIDSIYIGGILYYFPYKYKVNTQNTSITSTSGMTEYLMIFRLGEEYLIRAEAEANGAGGGISAAIVDLNKIRNRAGLLNYSGIVDKKNILDAILHERQVELFSEWGHRWLDLKRTGNIDVVMSTITPKKANGDSWQSFQQLYPLPLLDIQRDPQLSQNIGY